MYFVYVYENKMMKSDKIILRRRDGGWEAMMNLIKIRYKHICKCHKETPIQLIYANKNVKKMFWCPPNICWDHFI
jgi:hypothetical protein